MIFWIVTLMNINERVIIAIDGPNCGGKSETLSIIKSIITGATVIENHDFFHKHLIRQLNKSISYKMDFECLTIDERKHAQNYTMSRELSTISYINNVQKDDFIIERLYLTGLVYSDFLLNRAEEYVKHMKESYLSMPKVLFFYVTCDVETMLIRTNNNTEKQIIRRNNNTPYHLSEESAVVQKHMLYENYFHMLPFSNKTRIDTTNIKRTDLIKILKKIILSH